jgi:hypothetical protein
MDEIDRKINAAIESYPLAPLPAGFTRRVMQRIRPAHPAFRLSALDWLLPGFLGVFGMGSVAAVLLTIPLLDPLWLPRLKLVYQAVLLRMALLPDLRLLVMYAATLAASGLLAGLVLAAAAPIGRWVKAG